MSRGHHKTGPRRNRGDWLVIARGRANKNRTGRSSVRCPHDHHHTVPSAGFLAHLTSCSGGPGPRDRRRPGVGA